MHLLAGVVIDLTYRSMIGAACLIHESSAVQAAKLDLRVGGRELGVKARRSIPGGVMVYELFGATPIDVDGRHTKLSQIVKHESLTGPDGDRLLAGPMRLANHNCNPNCEVCAYLSSIACVLICFSGLQLKVPLAS